MMMMIVMRKFVIALFLPVMLFLASCQNDFVEEGTCSESGVCKLIMSATIESFDRQVTRSNGSTVWKDGDCVYLVFLKDDNKVEGRAIYDETNDDWTLYYDGILPNGQYSGKASYIEGVSDNKNIILLSHKNSVYVDDAIECEKTTEMMRINVKLTPQTGRIRFFGTPGQQFELTGVWNFTNLETSECSLNKEESGLSITINSDGYSDYIYCSFPQLSRTLSISYDKYIYSTVCEHPILDAGQSGYMELPTDTKHNGWNMTVLSLPTISKVVATSVENEGTTTFTADVLSAGNGTIRECGFVYSKNENPTISDGKVSCEDKEKLSATINGLTVDERYYVRAYATNQVGTSYSEQTSFIAGGGRPQDGDIDRPVLAVSIK
jgi:hypothetical protein